MEGRSKRSEPTYKRPLIESIQQLQDVYAQFSRAISPDLEAKQVHTLLQGEVDELHEALDSRDRQEIGAEIADVVFFAVELANQHGIVLNEALSAKMDRNHHKYNPFEVQKLIGQGLTHSEARAQLKANWDRGRDKDFK
jgi:NTP pyrophosphatase (non-canonical NTP hydrolase)